MTDKSVTMPRQALRSKLNNEPSTRKFDKHTLGKRVSKFLSKMFWHFNEVPLSYSTVNRRRSSSTDKNVPNLHQQQSSVDTNHDRIPYKKRYRTSSIRHRTLTLTSIKEENETELVNCK